MEVEDRKGSDLNGPTGSGLVLAIKAGSDFMGNKIKHTSCANVSHYKICDKSARNILCY